MATEPLLRVLTRMRGHLLDPDDLVRAVASGRRKGHDAPPWRRVEMRYVDLKAGRRLQLTRYDETQAHTSNHEPGEEAREAVDDLLDLPFGNWHVETTTETHQVRVTKKLQAAVHSRARVSTSSTNGKVEPDRRHDKPKERLLDPADPLFRTLGLADPEGRIKPSRQAKYRQVEELLRVLDTTVADAIDTGHLRRPTDADPLRIADLGCGNGYLTFAAHRLLTGLRGLPVRMIGIDVKRQSRDHNTEVATGLGVDAEFVVGSIHDAEPPERPDVVLALHACDTATDEALARAVEWEARVVLAAPCCHHDIAAQLRRAPTPSPYATLTRHGILRERLADTLTDGVRAALLRLEGYRVDVMEFVASEHTPRNTLLRGVRTGGRVKGGGLRKEYDDLVETWGISPRLAELLADAG